MVRPHFQTFSATSPSPTFPGQRGPMASLKRWRSSGVRPFVLSWSTPPYREIAHAAAALVMITPVMRDLESRVAYLAEFNFAPYSTRGPLEEWVTHYPITLRPPSSHAVRGFIGRTYASRSHVTGRLGGQLAAQRLTRFLKPAKFTIYTHQPVSRLIVPLRQRGNSSGNVEVLNAFWNFEPDPKNPQFGPACAPLRRSPSNCDRRKVEAANLIYEQPIETAFRPAVSTPPTEDFMRVSS
jgi:hypothetical protein